MLASLRAFREKMYNKELSMGISPTTTTSQQRRNNTHGTFVEGSQTARDGYHMRNEGNPIGGMTARETRLLAEAGGGGVLTNGIPSNPNVS